MSRLELHTFESEQALVEATARLWLEHVGRLAAGPGPFTLALSGGRVAQPFFVRAAALGAAVPEVWTRAHFFWADERCVPPADPSSNYALARQHLLDGLGIPESQVHRLRGEEEESAQAAAQATVELARWARPGPQGQPLLDLVLLGMGEDGHVASLFPGAEEAVVSRPEPYLAVTGPKPPPRRLSLSYAALAGAAEVWVLIAGPGKEQALGDALHQEGKTPLARVIRSRSQTRLLTSVRPG